MSIKDGSAMRKILLSTVLLALLFAGSCGKKKPETPENRLVVASIAPLASLANSVGGNHFDYRYIVPLSSNPHTFEPTPGDMKSVEKSTLFIYIGLRLDPWAQKMARYARTSTAVGDSIKKLGIRIDNPHNIWLEPHTVVSTARVIADALIKVAPELSDSIEAAYREFVSEVDSLMADISNYRPDTIKVAVYHGAWAGVLKSLGFHVVAVIANNPAQEPSLKRVNEVIRLCKEQRISFVIGESNFPTNVPKKVADEAGAKLIVANPLYNGEYVDALENLLKQIFEQGG